MRLYSLSQESLGGAQTLSAMSLQRKRKIDAHRRFADAALAVADRDEVTDARQFPGAGGRLGYSAWRGLLHGGSGLHGGVSCLMGSGVKGCYGVDCGPGRATG
jgi:hypothetical protein